MKIHKRANDGFTYCLTPWVDDGKKRITKVTNVWRLVTCHKCWKFKLSGTTRMTAGGKDEL